MSEYEGLKLETNGSVYAPAEDSYLLAAFIKEYLNGIRKRKLRVIDVGTGTGILGLSIARSKKVDSVLLSDISTEAIDLARRNYESNKEMMHAECSFVVSDLFFGIRGSFDIIIFNAPYLRREGKKKGEAWWDGGKDGIAVSLRFLNQSITHLDKGGAIFLVYSSLGNEDRLINEIEKLGLTVAESKNEHFFFEDIRVSRLEKE